MRRNLLFLGRSFESTVDFGLAIWNFGFRLRVGGVEPVRSSPLVSRPGLRSVSIENIVVGTLSHQTHQNQQILFQVSLVILLILPLLLRLSRQQRLNGTAALAPSAAQNSS